MDAKAIAAKVQSILPSKANLALHEPVFCGNEWKYVKECLDTGWVSSVGSYVGRFEELIAEYTDSRYAVAVVNGTAALHIALSLAGVKREDEVLVPDLTFIATTNAVAYCGAIPHFCDIAENTLGMDPEKLETYLAENAIVRAGYCFNRLSGRRISAIVPMHTFGHPVDLDALQDVCQRFGIVMVEDAAESLGSYYKEKHTGTYGKLATLSFNGNKVATTGGGGAVLTNDPILAKQCKHLTTTAKLPHRWEFNHDEIGYNYRLPNINAALGCAQMEQLAGFVEKKRKLAKKYQEAFYGQAGLKIFIEPEFAVSNYWLNAIILEKPDRKFRDELLEEFHSVGVQARPAWTLMHRLPMYADCPRMDLSVAESMSDRVVNLPSGAGLL